MSVRLAETRFFHVKPHVWDEFAQKCSGSIRGAYGHMLGWAAKNLGRYRLRFFEFYVGEGAEVVKIGQCAVGAGPNGAFIFLSRLQLLPAWVARWNEAMEAVLAALGPGTYEYGWALNIESPRDADLEAIAGVSIESTQALVVQAVDFSQWASWEAYYRAVSENSRRNAKSAERNLPNLRLVTRTGLRTLLAVPTLVRLRALMSDRKRLGVRASALAVSFVGTIVSSPRYMVTCVAKDGARALSGYYSAEFGPHTYYFEGASVGDNGGAAWHLLIAMLRRAYERTPTGTFIMGYVDYATHSDEVSAGLLRSRNACRVTNYPTSVVRFRYQPA